MKGDRSAIEREARDALDRAIRVLLIEEPFYAHILGAVPRRITEVVRTAAVGFHHPDDGVCRLMINPRFFLSLSEPHRIAVVKHEVLHLVLRHPFRDAGRDPQILGIAADLVVNQLVAPWPLPANAVTLEHFAPLGLREDQTLDHYYARLEQAAKERPAFAEWLAGGDGDTDESGAPSPERGVGPGEHTRWPKEKSAAMRSMAKLTADAIEQAWERTSEETRSRLPEVVTGHAEALLRERRKPLDWTRRLRRFAQSVRRAPLRNTIRRPSRRFGSYPGLKLRRASRLAVVVDTSGSLEVPEIEQFFAEVHGIWRAGAEVVVIECDAEVQRATVYDGNPPATSKGRGGTSFDPAFAWIRREELRRPFDGVIYLTDGYANPPTIRPRCRHLLWVLCPGGTERYLVGGAVLRLRGTIRI